MPEASTGGTVQLYLVEISGETDVLNPLYSALKEESMKDTWKHNPTPFD